MNKHSEELNVFIEKLKESNKLTAWRKQKTNNLKYTKHISFFDNHDKKPDKDSCFIGPINSSTIMDRLFLGQIWNNNRPDICHTN